MHLKSSWLFLVFLCPSVGCSDNSGSDPSTEPEGSGAVGSQRPETGGAGLAPGTGDTGGAGITPNAGGTSSGGMTSTGSTGGSGGLPLPEPGSCPEPSVVESTDTASTVTVTVEADSPRQKITLMGGDMERSAGFLDNATNAQEVADWLYKDIDFGVSRVSYDRKQELTEGDPTYSFYDKPISAMKKVQVARPEVKFWATLKSDYDGYGSVNNLPDWVYTGGGYNGGSYDPTKLNTTKYARFLADYLQLMHENGVPISVLEVSKEWTQVVDAERERQTIVALTSLLETSEYADVPHPRFAAPGGWGVTGTTSFVNKAATVDSLGLYEGISVHSYDNPSESEWETLISTAASHGLPVWHTESTIGGGGPYSGAEPGFIKIITELEHHSRWYRQGLEGELFFENWSRGVTTETRIVYFQNGQPGVRLRGYYVMKQFANHAADSIYIPTVIDGADGLESMAFLQGKRLTVWMLNDSEESLVSAIAVQGAELHGSCVERLAWVDGPIITGTADTLAPTDETAFQTVLPPESVTSLVFELK